MFLCRKVAFGCFLVDLNRRPRQLLRGDIVGRVYKHKVVSTHVRI